MNQAQNIEYAELLEEQIRRNNLNKAQRVYDSLYPWQLRFNTKTKDYTACMLMAANQVGKTRTGTLIDAYHLTGDYPDGWGGHVFERPIMGWLLGYSGEKTRDLLQHKLFGRLVPNKGLEGGLISQEKIIDYKSMPGTSGAVREVRVKHEKGISTCQFWSYSQGQHALMGDKVDWYHFDEEPEDPEIYPQVLTRTINGDRGRGGRGILTFTPENGKTPLVCQFMGENYEGDDEEEIDFEGQCLQTATWNDAPHITKEKAKKFLAKYPKYQRDMRSKGIPLMGTGLIYEHDEDDLSIAPFKPPEYWFIINGMDFGWDHPQAHIQMIEDRDANIFYFTNAWKKSGKHPYEAWHVIKAWAEGIPTAWPPDGLKGQLKSSGSNPKDGATIKELYVNEGFNMLEAHATWDDGTNSVQRGIMEFNNLMDEGRIKIFSNLFEIFEELRQYHIKTNAQQETEIVKIKDDLLDAMRYAYMMRRYAIRICDLNMDEWVEPVSRITGDLYD